MKAGQRVAKQGIRNMRIDFRRADTGVTEHLLHGQQVGASFDEMGGKGVSESVRTDVPFNAV